MLLHISLSPLGLENQADGTQYSATFLGNFAAYPSVSIRSPLKAIAPVYKQSIPAL
jgi:hypothetical protein